MRSFTIVCVLIVSCTNAVRAQDDVDHAGLIRGLDAAALARGEEIYRTTCFACHGLDGKTPTNPLARSFATAAMANGAGPHALFKTLTDGFNTMPSVTFLTPSERYDVIHYIREAFLKSANPTQYVAVTDEYLAQLPKAKQSTRRRRGPVERDFGPVLASQLGRKVNNGLTYRLPHGVSFNYDLHRMRSGGVWTDGFLDLSQTHHYKQRGEGLPMPGGLMITGLTTYGWQLGGSFELPKDAKRPRGPVRSEWLTYRGHYLHGDQAVLSYVVHGRDVLEVVGVDRSPTLTALHHTFRIEPGAAMRLAVAQLGEAGMPAGLVAPGETQLNGARGPAAGRLAVVMGPSLGTALPRFTTPTADGAKLDLGNVCTVIVQFRTREDGTLVTSAAAEGAWGPGAKALHVRGGRVVFTVEGVGEVVSKRTVDDGNWHSAAMIVNDKNVRLFIDVEGDAGKPGLRAAHLANHVFRVGEGYETPFPGQIARVLYYGRNIKRRDIRNALGGEFGKPLLDWRPGVSAAGAETTVDRYAAAAVVGDTGHLSWEIDAARRVVLSIPADESPRVFRVLRSADEGMNGLARFGEYVTFSASNETLTDPRTMTRGGPTRWERELAVTGQLGDSVGGYALDTIPVPFENPYNAWLRTSAVDFFADGRAAVSTHGGDVWIVSGVDDALGKVTWKRYVAGLFEPFGVRIVDAVVYVTTRDGIKRLHDFDGNGEADFVEAFHVDEDVSSMFHAFNFDLQTDSAGNFYFAKAGQYTNYDRPGTIMKVTPDGGPAEIVAWGIRTPNGMGKLADDRFTVSDNQGPWMPAGKVSLIRPGAFLGNMPNGSQRPWTMERHGGELPKTFDEPFIWTPQDLDSSCGGQVWVADERFGPLAGRLIHSSFGKGWLYYLSLQELEGTMQASIVTLPHQWAAGVMRLRVSPRDGQVYGVGLSGWQGPRGGKDGCFQRLRYTGEPVRMIERTKITATGIELTFNFALDPATARDPNSWKSEMWDYKWSARYGSDQFSVRSAGTKGHDAVAVSKAELGADGTVVHLTMPGLAVCDQLEMKVAIADAAGGPFEQTVYFTIHAIPDE